MVDVEPSPAIQIDGENRAFHRHMSHNMSGPTVTIPSRFTLQEDRYYQLLLSLVHHPSHAPCLPGSQV